MQKLVMYENMQKKINIWNQEKICKNLQYLEVYTNVYKKRKQYAGYYGKYTKKYMQENMREL